MSDWTLLSLYLVIWYLHKKSKVLLCQMYPYAQPTRAHTQTPVAMWQGAEPVDVSSHNSVLVTKGKLLKRRKYLLKNTVREIAWQPGSPEPGNQKHPWKVQLASLKYIWVPRNGKHPEVPSISAKTRNCNREFLSEKVEAVQENKIGSKEQKTSLPSGCYR